ncbi:cryptochrome/photolyase family protein [Streptomyces sp. NPDC000941]
MRVSVALFTADLRVHDNPVLNGALREAESVVPLFVIDSGIRDADFVVPNRAAFLADCLADLDAALRARGGRLVVRRGEVVQETCRVAARVGAGAVHVAGGASAYAARREARLRAALARGRRELRVHEGAVTVVAPGVLVPSGSGRPGQDHSTSGGAPREDHAEDHSTSGGAPRKDHFAVFTPYYRRWRSEPWRAPLRAPRVVRVPSVRSVALPTAASLAPGAASPGLPAGGETAARRRLRLWVAGPLADYAGRQDDLAGDATSRLSPYLHFGCLSPVEVARRALDAGGPGAEAFVRQLAWRDFHHQVLAARPDAAHRDYRPRHDRWRHDADEIAAWCAGLTGYPVVDAAMRQLMREGWMPGRARLVAASFLAKTLYVDWRTGARHFLALLVDGDIANNQLNWQWVAGTGTDTRPGRILNPLTQALRHDPEGEYVRRWVPELAAVQGPAVHRPWRLPGPDRAALAYPDPIVDLAEAADRFRRGRG